MVRRVWVGSVVLTLCLGVGVSWVSQASSEKKQVTSAVKAAACTAVSHLAEASSTGAASAAPSVDGAEAPWDAEPGVETRLAMLETAAASLPEGVGHSFCFAPDTPIEVVQAFCELHPELCGPPEFGPRYQFSDPSRWPGGQGAPTALSWSFVPDGVGSSSLFVDMDAKFGGNRATWIAKFQESFDRWQELTGVTYTRVTDGANDWDDGSSWGTSGNDLTRGDIRIRMIFIDGPSGILAFNSFPTNGDMSIDKDESWQSSANNYRFLRNVVMHEHGHGLGISHICPVVFGSGGMLMNPFINTNFDGLAHDDIRAGQRGYGDPSESDNSFGTANDLGTILFGSPLTDIGVTPPPLPTNESSILSIDANSEEDWFKFTVTTASTGTVTVRPVGYSYDSSPQSGACNGQGINCCSGNIIDSSLAAQLAVSFYQSDGTTLIDTATAAALGNSVGLVDVALPGSAGGADFYIRVFESAGHSPTASQLYLMDVSVTDTAADVTPPSPNPMTWQVPPTPVSTSELTMTADVATDADNPPVEYFFDALSGGGANDSPWQSSQVYNDNGLNENTLYIYRLRARDSAPPPGPNLTDDSVATEITTATHLSTPTAVLFENNCSPNPCNLTTTSIEMQAQGNFNGYWLDQSAFFFDCLDAGCDTGISVWLPWPFNPTTPQPIDEATGLQSGTFYTFQIKTRNRVGIESPGWSPVGGKATLARTPAAPTLSNPTANTMQVDVNPNGNPSNTAEFAILCTGTNPFDAVWDGMYLDASGNPGALETWQTDIDWGVATALNLLPSTQYTFAVKARNEVDHVETGFGTSASLTTSAGGGCPTQLGDVNGDTFVTGDDIPGYVRVKLGTPSGGDVTACADFGTGTVDGDTALFVAALLAGP